MVLRSSSTASHNGAGVVMLVNLELGLRLEGEIGLTCDKMCRFTVFVSGTAR